MLCLIAMTTGVTFAQVGTTNYLNEKRGFKIFTLGDSISVYADKVKLLAETGSNTKEYSVADSIFLSIGDKVKITAIN